LILPLDAVGDAVAVAIVTGTGIALSSSLSKYVCVKGVVIFGA
jgi:hypothetical protein